MTYKSPLNYSGGKFKLLPQILPLFPAKIDTFIDLFGGGFNVGANVEANEIIYNDINTEVSDVLLWMQTCETDDMLNSIDELISRYKLGKYNKEAYLKLRQDYNNNKNPLMLCVLIWYSFNNQIRFNSKGEFNMPFGEREFNQNLRKNFIDFCDRIHSINVHIYNRSFDEFDFSNVGKNNFIYCDPPYLVSCATYNHKMKYDGWNISQEKKLLDLLDSLNSNGARFALSELTESKGKTNSLLLDWCEKYNVHEINSSYKNCNYQRKQSSKDVEVLITNY